MAFTLQSPAFADGGRIPDKYARKQENISPPLAWSDAPSGTRSFAVVVEDPDAPSRTFRHWAIYDLDATRTGLAEGEGAGRSADGPRQAVNDFGNPHYDGPQPPQGHGVHHYHFKLLALDVESLDLEKAGRIDKLLAAAQPHILASAELVGTFEQPQ